VFLSIFDSRRSLFVFISIFIYIGIYNLNNLLSYMTRYINSGSLLYGFDLSALKYPQA